MKHLILALSVAAVQNAVAVFDVHSSSQNVLSDGACIGGVYGTLANLLIFGLVMIWAITLAGKSFKETHWHPGLKPLMIVALSSATAILIGQYAGFRCTV